MRKTTSARREVCLTLALAIGLQVAFAASAQTKQPSRTVEIGELGPAVRVSLAVGDTLRVVLPSTPSTGYSWRATGDDTAGAMQIQGSEYKASHQRPGASGTQTFTLTAKSPGQDHLRLNYARPWEKNAKPARAYAVSITVNPAGSGSESPVVTPTGTRIGTYSGTSHCADCSGIVTAVALYAASQQPMTNTYYVRTMRYQGSPQGDTLFVSAGNWSRKTGTPADTKAVVYSLRSNTSDHVDTYQLDGDSLVVIGSDGKPAQNPYNTSLQKQH